MSRQNKKQETARGVWESAKRIWPSARPLLWMALLFAGVLLALAGLVSQDWTEFIVPPPENSAEQLVNALGAHRYEGAMNQLSQDLQQQVKEEDLQALVKTIEQSPAQGIQDAHGQGAQEQGDQATAEVQVKLGTNEEVPVELPLTKENGVWKVSSLDPLRSLAMK